MTGIQRTLYHGDNLPFLRSLPDESVDLIATDPPFNTGRDFSTDAGTFTDRWTWEPQCEEWLSEVRRRSWKAGQVITTAKAVQGNDTGAFLCRLCLRLMEMQRALTSKGCLYLQIDDTAHAWLKCLLDAVFGRENFRNAVVWPRASVKGTRGTTKTYGKVSDTVLFYAKSTEHILEVPISTKERKVSFPHTDSVGQYRAVTQLYADARLHNCAKFEWKGHNPEHGWRVSPTNLEYLNQEDRIHYNGSGRPYRKQYDFEYEGVKVGDLWDDINSLHGSESVDYPTQKPLALYDRIIRASSNPGDLILDPFAGSGTTLIAAERLGRQWIGMDLWPEIA